MVIHVEQLSRHSGVRVLGAVSGIGLAVVYIRHTQ
jgi:hypothetical protein